MLKKHWFKIFILLLVLFFLAFFVIIAASPRQDLKGRGFIPCTQALVSDLTDCQNSKICALKSIIKNNYCDLGVIAKGFSLWLKGGQNTPWSNYLFEPELNKELEYGEENN